MGYPQGLNMGMTAKTDEYYKIQFRDLISLAWKDVQKSFPSVEDAMAAFTPDKEWRVMCVTPKGRFPL
jgi:hypothetical protein